MAVQQDIAPRARSPEGGHRAPLGLVLTGGGARAAYQVGALAAIAEAVPDLAFPIVTGVSAGAINAAFLAAHPGPFAAAIAALRAEWGRLTAERVYRVRPGRWGRALLRWLGAPALGGRGGGRRAGGGGGGRPRGAGAGRRAGGARGGAGARRGGGGGGRGGCV